MPAGASLQSEKDKHDPKAIRLRAGSIDGLHDRWEITGIVSPASDTHVARLLPRGASEAMALMLQVEVETAPTDGGADYSGMKPRLREMTVEATGQSNVTDSLVPYRCRSAGTVSYLTVCSGPERRESGVKDAVVAFMQATE